MDPANGGNQPAPQANANRKALIIIAVVVAVLACVPLGIGAVIIFGEGSATDPFIDTAF